MDYAALITLTLDERGAEKIAADEDLSFVDEHFGWGESVTLEPVTLKGKRLVQLTLNGKVPEWWGAEIVKHVPWAIALTYGTDSSVTNYLDTVAGGQFTTVEFEGPKGFLEAARAIEEVLAEAQPVQESTLEQMKARLRSYGVLVEGAEDAAA